MKKIPALLLICIAITSCDEKKEYIPIKEVKANKEPSLTEDLARKLINASLKPSCVRVGLYPDFKLNTYTFYLDDFYNTYLEKESDIISLEFPVEGRPLSSSEAITLKRFQILSDMGFFEKKEQHINKNLYGLRNDRYYSDQVSIEEGKTKFLTQKHNGVQFSLTTKGKEQLKSSDKSKHLNLCLGNYVVNDITKIENGRVHFDLRAANQPEWQQNENVIKAFPEINKKLDAIKNMKSSVKLNENNGQWEMTDKGLLSRAVNN